MVMLNNTRAIASMLILEVLNHQQPLTKVLAAFKKNCPKDMDTAFVQALAFGVLRWLPRLDFVLHELLEKTLKAKDKDLQYLLYVGLFQLMFLHFPCHLKRQFQIALDLLLLLKESELQRYLGKSHLLNL